QIFLSLADVFTDDTRQIYAIEIERQRVRKHFRRHRLSGTARSGKERADPETASTDRAESPRVVNSRAMSHVRSDFAKLAQLFGRQNEILPFRNRLDTLGQIIQTQTCLRAAGVPQFRSE